MSGQLGGQVLQPGRGRVYKKQSLPEPWHLSKYRGWIRVYLCQRLYWQQLRDKQGRLCWWAVYARRHLCWSCRWIRLHMSTWKDGPSLPSRWCMCQQSLSRGQMRYKSCWRSPYLYLSARFQWNKLCSGYWWVCSRFSVWTWRYLCQHSWILQVQL